MPTCPKCKRMFRVPEGDKPEEHGCPSCGYGQDPRDYEEEEEE